MGAEYSCTNDWLCGRTPGEKPQSKLTTDPAILAVSAWIKAREAGNVEEAAALCHPDFSFTSPQLSLVGLEKAKQKLFAQVAPEPEAILMPLRMTNDGLVYREISFKVGYQRLAIRQEWTIIYDKNTDRPLISSVSATRV